MHEGVLPYVDVGDCKPLGLFVIYYVIAAFSRAIWAYQLVAWVFLAATAWVVYRIVLTWTNRQGAFLAGLIYAVFTCVFRGVNGQAPVIFNLFVATTVLLIIRDFPSHFRGVCGWRSLACDGIVRPRHRYQANRDLRIAIPWTLYSLGPASGASANPAIDWGCNRLWCSWRCANFHNRRILCASLTAKLV